MIEGAELDLFARSILHATEAGQAEEVDSALSELGWRDALEVDQRAAVSLLFDAQGRTGATSSALDDVLTSALLPMGDHVGQVAIVLSPLRGHDAPGRIRSEGLAVRGLGTGTLTRRERVVVVAHLDDGYGAYEASASAFTTRPVQGIDPWLGLVDVAGTLPLARETPARPATWDAAISLGQLALAHELVGAGRGMLELARQHALDRVQFGRPISMFQAVRHRLAESLIAIEAADSLLAAAWDNPSPASAAMAKGMAGRSARTAAKHCQQVLAGIGFTAEHPFHRYLKRIVVLDQLLGAGKSLTRQLGTDVLASRTLPPTFPL